MGTDKALLEVDGVPMALRVAGAMRDAGATEVLAVGGDAGGLSGLGLRCVPDEYPGEGPLGGIITALRAVCTVRANVYLTSALVVISACDMPWIEARHVTPLVDALAGDPDADVAVAGAQHLLGAWRTQALSVLERRFAEGERAPKRALTGLRVLHVDLPSGAWAADVDTPGDLA
jgi:molybdopterin-guanine dinucleotide biosynthesis protein A